MTVAARARVPPGGLGPDTGRPGALPTVPGKGDIRGPRARPADAGPALRRALTGLGVAGSGPMRRPARRSWRHWRAAWYTCTMAGSGFLTGPEGGAFPSRPPGPWLLRRAGKASSVPWPPSASEAPPVGGASGEAAGDRVAGRDGPPLSEE